MTSPADHDAFERILDHLRQARGFDFTAYKRTSLMRRVVKRMQTIGVEQFDRYLDRLQVHPDEFNALFNTILINVTGFFRDIDVWDHLRTAILPSLLSARPDAPLRLWSAGAASGQEAYSAAMILAELIGRDAYKERVKIYATDVDEDALGEARRAVYNDKQLADVPPDLVAKYFEKTGELFTFDRDLRRGVIFGRHDLIHDAPISRVDLLLCRNTLMYFNADAQARIMARFYFSLNPGGFLVLGRAEMLFSHASLFQAVDLKRRIFTVVPKVNPRERLLLIAQSGREDIMAQYPNHGRLRDAAFESSADAQIVLDPMGVLVAANAQARRVFSLSTGDLGSPLQDLELSYRPAELRPALDRALQDRREVALRNIPLDHSGTVRFLDVVLVPLYEDDGTALGARISFIDVTPMKSLQDELTNSKQELETAYEELQSTNEELETTNEELQSTVEELETTNEELQSTNEELETMNEELQSTNEELQTMNDELRNRGTELNASNAFLEAVFTSLRSAVVVIDRELRIQVWNSGASDLWGLRSEEAQQAYFFSLDIGLPVADLHQPLKEVLGGNADHREITLRAISRKGRSMECRVSIAPLLGSDRAVTGAILLMDDASA
ncbi:MAG TPA: CheR family methyltransferase [Vicinamibacterales bacterium]|jgi:two-component system CheB/CheR fusion protein|nr:CheR family methyltransferase [Vicinamibacterales bacterium]